MPLQVWFSRDFSFSPVISALRTDGTKSVCLSTMLLSNALARLIKILSNKGTDM